MNDVSADSAPMPAPELPAGSFAGRESFREHVRAALSEAARAGWREIVLSDAHFLDWPLGERAVVEDLTRWAMRGQRLTLLARRYDELQRAHPLFVRWRRQWDHRIDCRQVGASEDAEIPSLIWTPAWALQRLEPVRFAGVCGPEPERRQSLRLLLDEWLQRSTPGFPATTLGL